MALATAPAGGQPFISPDLSAAAGVAVAKSGYNITYVGSNAVASAPITCNAVAAGLVVANYLALGDPQSWGTSGNRHFGTSEAQTIFQMITDVPVTITALGVSNGTPLK